MNTILKRFKSNHILALTIGLVYIWFGLLKFFPSYSPAEELAKKTIEALTFDMIPSNLSIKLLAIWETVIGLLLTLNLFRFFAIKIALVHMFFTFSPLFLFPFESFSEPPFLFSLLGQYIFKNIIIIAALITLYKLHLSKK